MLGSFFIGNNNVHDLIKVIRHLYYIFAGTMQCFVFAIFLSEIIDQKDLLLYSISRTLHRFLANSVRCKFHLKRAGAIYENI